MITFLRSQRARQMLAATVSVAALAPALPAFAADLVIAVQASREPQNLDYQVDPYTSTILFDSFMSDPLVIIDSEGQFVPGLAESWEASADATEYTMVLKQGVTFQDGTPFNAAAVVYNIERALAPETASALLAANIGPLEKVEAIDEYTVKFTYKEPWMTFLDMATKAPMWSPTAASASTPQEFDKQLIGTGPFKLKEWVANDHITLEKWDDYGGWNSVQEHEGAALIDSVTIRFIGEPAVLGSMVLNGEAHIGYEIPPLSVEEYAGNADFTVMTKGQSGTGLQMVMNTARPPLNDVRVRQALLHGRDMKLANDILYDGLYGESDGPLNNIHPCFWPGATEIYPYDPAKAAALLDEAGWVDDGSGTRKAQGVEGVADGTSLSIGWTILHHPEIGEFVQAQLKQIGVDLRVEVVPGPVQLERATNRDFDLMYERLRNSDPQILDDVWNPAYTQPGGWSWSGFEDPSLTALLDQISRNTDNAARCTAAQDAQEIIMENALMFPTLTQPSFFAISNTVKGFKLGSEGTRFFIHDVSIDG